MRACGGSSKNVCDVLMMHVGASAELFVGSTGFVPQGAALNATAVARPSSLLHIALTNDYDFQLQHSEWFPLVVQTAVAATKRLTTASKTAKAGNLLILSHMGPTRR